MILSKIHIYLKIMKKKPCHVFGQLHAFIITSCKTNCSKKISYEKTFSGGKRIYIPFLH